MILDSIIITLISLAPFMLRRFTKSYFFFALFALPAIAIHGIYLFGYMIIYFLLIIFAVSTLAELISLKTHFNVFGVKYRYNLGHSYFSSKINLLKVYPVEVSLTWVSLKYISFCMALIISSAFLIPKNLTIVMTSLILLSLDFVIDPIAVKAKMWKWEKGSPYFGIPFRNFAGWFIVGLVSSELFFLMNPVSNIQFNYLYILPIIFYILVAKNITYMFKYDKTKALIGVVPALIWIILSVAGLIILYVS